MNVALLMLGVGDEYCGGAERFFSYFFDIYKQAGGRHRLYFITDRTTFKTLLKLNRLPQRERVKIIPEANNRFKRVIDPFFFVLTLLLNRIHIVHVTSYGRNYYDRIKAIEKIPSFLRPKLIINIVDCEIPYGYLDETHAKHGAYIQRYKPLFENIHIDGIYTWYERFRQFADEHTIIRSRPFTGVASTRFADEEVVKKNTAKQDEIVYAARLVEQKRPSWFVEAVRVLAETTPALMKGWKFSIYGRGPQEAALRKQIEMNNLGEWLEMDSRPDMTDVFQRSKCFVSTQDYENFPSLSMSKAMAAGNAIIARNVGQTANYVKDGLNGILLKEDSPKGLSDAIRYYLEHSELHASMQESSFRIIREEHTRENFIKEIEKFWEEVKRGPTEE